MIGRYRQSGEWIRLPLVMATLAVMVWLAGPVQAATVVQAAAANPPYAVSSGYSVLDLNITNNDTGAIYNSGTLNVLKGLDEQLWALPVNQATYATRQQMMAAWGVSLRAPPTGEVANGWNKTLNSDASVSLTHIPGIPNVSYKQWLSTSANPNQDMMAITISIPTSQLDLDGVGGYDPTTDARIELGSSLMADAFVAHTTTGFDIWGATAYGYVLVRPGDVNADGHVDVVDLLYVVEAFGSAAGEVNYDPACDFNADDSVDVVDLLTMVEYFGV